jgi:ATP-binding cassette subfamily B (MDR/TAP) protein 1
MVRVAPDASSSSAAAGGALEEPLLARESSEAAAARQLRHEQEALLHGPLLALREQHEAEAESGAPSAVSRLAGELGWREWALLAGGLVAACGFGATPALQARLMGNVFSGGAGADPHALRNNIERNVPRLLELGAFAFMCGYLQLLLLSTMGERVVRRVKARCLAGMLRQEVAFFDSKSTGQLATLLAEQSQALLKGLSDSVGQGVQFTAQIVVSYTIAFHTNAHVAVTLMGFLPVLSILVVVLILFAIRTFKKLDKVNEQAGGLAEEMLSAYQTVASFTSEPRAVAKYDAVLRDAEQLGLKLVAIRSVGVSVLFTLLYATFGMSYWYGSQLIADGKSDFGSVLTTVFTCIIGAMSIGGFVPVAQGIGQTNTAVRSLYAIIDRRPRMAGEEEAAAAAAAEGNAEDEDDGRCHHHQQLRHDQQAKAGSGTAGPRLDGPVCFDNVSFAYANRATGVLSGVSFTALPGQTTALVGGSGSGKSTCISLLERFYDVTGGQITLSGVPLHRIDVHHLRRSIGLVQQEPVMFQLSVADNIWLGMDGPKDMARIETAARSANAHAFIAAWPQGYDTDMGSGGTQVSGGQRQRIAIARAIVRDPAMYVGAVVLCRVVGGIQDLSFSSNSVAVCLAGLALARGVCLSLALPPNHQIMLGRGDQRAGQRV